MIIEFIIAHMFKPNKNKVSLNVITTSELLVNKITVIKKVVKETITFNLRKLNKTIMLDIQTILLLFHMKT